MIKEYLRHNRTARTLLGPIKRVLDGILFADTGAGGRNYRNSVVGGALIVAPRNIEGTFELSAISDVANRVVTHGCYEPEVTAVLSKLKLKPGLIVNIGANIGLYSIFLARTFPNSTRVLSVEPNPEAFQYLSGNIERNGMADRIQPVQACVGDSEGALRLSVIAGKPEYSSIGSIAHPSVASLEQISLLVRVLPLSALVGNEPVAMIFVDAEGAESNIFAGAKDVLERDRPLLFFECSNTLLSKFGSSSRALESQLQSLGYVVRNGLSQRLRLRHPFEGEAIAIYPAESSQ